MIFSYKKLLKLANLENVSIDNMTKAINSIGFEVESYEKFADVEGIKFGHVLKTYKNPNADRLTVCEIEFEGNVKRIIQTTATNVKENDYLMAFIPGSRSKNIVFAEKVMQGINSQGMLVGLSEIGFKNDVVPQEYQDGIFTFSKVDLSLDPIEYFELDDYLIDVTILSNRADALCYLIMAKELAAYFNTIPISLKKPTPTMKSNINVSKKLIGTNHLSYVEAKNYDVNLKLNELAFLWKNNVKTFNNVIDLTNLVLLYAGVPCNVYSNLKSNEFLTEYSSEEVLILGNKPIKLNSNLVVKNGSEIIALAATIGLENKFISTASNVIFELASFNILDVRKNAKQIKFDTLSSQRASKEISLGQIHLAYQFLSEHLTFHSQLINPGKISNQTIFVDEKLIDKYAGFGLTKISNYLDVLKKLQILDFKYNKKMKEITFPSYRYDLKQIQDLIEEIFRFYGYDNFKPKEPTILPHINISDEINVLSMFKYKGYSNIRTFTLIKPENNIFNPFSFLKTYATNNSKNYEHSEIRNSMIFSLNDAIVNNKKQGILKNSFFEIGMINNQNNVLGIVSNEKSFDEICCDILSLTNKKLMFKKPSLDIFNNNASALIFNDQDEMIGYVAKLNPNFLKSDAFFAEITLDKINNFPYKYKPYNKMPLKSRDITVCVHKNQSIIDTINKLNSLKGIFEIKVKDIYQKSEDERNITLSILLEDWATKKFDKDFNND